MASTTTRPTPTMDTPRRNFRVTESAGMLDSRPKFKRGSRQSIRHSLARSIRPGVIRQMKRACADCGTIRDVSRSCRPVGEYRCHPCRRIAKTKAAADRSARPPKPASTRRPCSICGTMRAVTTQSRSAVICQRCRRTGHSPRKSPEERRAANAHNARQRRAAGLVKSPGNHRTRALAYGVEYQYVNPLRVFTRDQWICGICGLPVDRTASWPHPLSATLDHVIPMCRGGGHTYANTQCAHWRCNHRKAATPLEILGPPGAEDSSAVSGDFIFLSAMAGGR